MMNEMWLDCWTNTNYDVYSQQQHSIYDEFNMHSMIELHPYKPKQHFTHYNKSSEIHDDNIEPVYCTLNDVRPTSKIIRRHYPKTSCQQNRKKLSSPSTIKTESNVEQKQLLKAKKKKISSFTTPDILCLVCGDQSSGCHYGVNTCEGCKGFFRRAVTRRVSQRCNYIDNCEITLANRNFCQHCRLKKCIDVGMSRDASRLGRPPKQLHSDTKKDKPILSTNCLDLVNSTFPYCLFQDRQVLFVPKIHQEILRKLTSMLLYQEKLLTDIETKEIDYIAEVIINGHRQFNIYTLGKTQIKIEENPPIQADSIKDELNGDPALVWANWQLTLPFENILKTFKSYTFFQEISQDDQICLLRHGAFETILVNWFNLFDIERKLMLTPDFSAYIDRDFIKTIKTVGIFMLEIFDLGIKANHLPWTDSDIALFNALLLMNPERSDLCDKERIEQTEAKLMQVLYRHLRCHHPNEPNMFLNMLQLIPTIQEVNQIHLDAIRYIKRHERHVFDSLPDIYREIYEDLSP